jgi:DNA-directed RNA polymerase specialized sigma subunit
MGRKLKPSIDLGLAVIAAVRQPGERMTAVDIAEICGVSQAAIWQIERKAIAKLQRAAARRKL